MMHMRGTPQTMQSMTHYEDIVKEILFYFSEK
jgi:dihydropteroate synthase